MMAAPVIDSLTVDKPVYAPGDKVTLTVKYHDPDAYVDVITVTPQNLDGSVRGVSQTVNVVVSDPVVLALASLLGKTYAKVSDDGKTAVLTATA